ncbi:hypothetical protein NDU88_002365 [Pleurodeles waltl]|uniref:Uncharacterized protein n=1 Tax=Pleurodeles waltl TaxID=8319 RepID=A0AAV7T2M9_PLEWA|nr:hypothetical protein NDU88_002365 [Pleurodeles waltl]
MQGRGAENKSLAMKEGASLGTQRVSGCIAGALCPKPRHGAAGTAPAPERKTLDQPMQARGVRRDTSFLITNLWCCAAR